MNKVVIGFFSSFFLIIFVWFIWFMATTLENNPDADLSNYHLDFKSSLENLTNVHVESTEFIQSCLNDLVKHSNKLVDEQFYISDLWAPIDMFIDVVKVLMSLLVYVVRIAIAFINFLFGPKIVSIV